TASIGHGITSEKCDGVDNDCNGLTDEGGPALCSDGDPCNGTEVCGGAQGCLAGTPPSCDDGNACTQDSCMPFVGCQHAGISNCHGSNPRVDRNCGNACTADTCVNGFCQFANAVVCTASDQCHDAGTCNAATGLCSNPAKVNGTSCNDGNACTQGDSCEAGACVGSALECMASDQCHSAGTCDPQTGTCSNPAKTNGTSCNDGNACTHGD